MIQLTARQNQRTVFTVERSSGVWQVSRDGLFAGDFLTRGEAVAAARGLAHSFESLGGAAEVVVPSRKIVARVGRQQSGATHEEL